MNMAKFVRDIARLNAAIDTMDARKLDVAILVSEDEMVELVKWCQKLEYMVTEPTGLPVAELYILGRRILVRS